MVRAIVVHGGAWEIPDRHVAAHEKGCAEAARLGYDVLRAGGAAIDAVETAVRLLEDDETFDAGRGGFLNRDGVVELDAGIMNGSTLASAAVAAVRGVAHPVTLARRLLESNGERLVVGPGATLLAQELGIETIDPSLLATNATRALWETTRREDPHAIFEPRPRGTVGAVALDDPGDIVAATSTGGLPGKRPGRVGDSPIVGAGFYADAQAGGASSTGDGEAILTVGLARLAVEQMRAGVAARVAARAALMALAEPRVSGVGGLITVDTHGGIGVAHTTTRMAWAWIDVEGQLFCGIDGVVNV